MRLIQIKNENMFESDEPKKYHTYAVYYDKKAKENRAIQMTHLYKKDNKRFNQLKNGLLKKVKFQTFECPSGVHREYYNKNINGKKLNFSKYKTREVVSDELAKEIKKFAKHQYRNKKW